MENMLLALALHFKTALSKIKRLAKALRLPAAFFTCMVLILASQHQSKVQSNPEIVADNCSSPIGCTEDSKIKLTKDDVLSDMDSRVSDKFLIPDILKKRTKFWLDIYTQYGTNKHVIHHSIYPWVVYKVVDTSEIHNSKLHKWTRYHKAKKLVAKEKKRIILTLRRLSKKTSFRGLNKSEKALFNALKVLRGKRKNVFNTAAQNIRTQLGQKDFFYSALQSSKNYLPFMEDQFRRAGLPTELTRIPFVESSFNLQAYSKVGAAGIWQIMPRVGRERMIVSRNIDERMSPYKSTLHASKHLRRDYKILKSWPLAVNAYNLGVGNMKKLLRKYKTKRITSLISRAKGRGFGFAAKNFYPSFLAALHAEKYKEVFFSLPNDDPYEQIYSLKTKGRIRAHKLVDSLNVPPEIFLNHNFELRRAMKFNLMLPKNFLIFLPESYLKEIRAESKVPSTVKITSTGYRAPSPG